MAKNLTEIASALSHRYSEMTNKKALEVTRFVLAQVIKGVVELEPDSRDRVVLAQLGNFGVKKTQPRKVRNITTGEMVDVPANVRIIFKATDFLKNAVLTGEFEIPEAGAEAPAEEEAPADAEPAKKEKKAPAKKPAAKKSEEIDENDIPDISDL